MTKTKMLACLLALVFLLSGAAKLAGLEFEIRAFERWGYPLWFMYLSGVVEIAGAVGLLIPRLSALTAACLALFMSGAVGTHLIHSEWLMSYIAGSIMLAAALGAWDGLKN
jgi:uncharacterized membrane protein YphA (DoxX/SURF4 family)